MDHLDNRELRDFRSTKEITSLKRKGMAHLPQEWFWCTVTQSKSTVVITRRLCYSLYENSPAIKAVNFLPDVLTTKNNTVQITLAFQM